MQPVLLSSRHIAAALAGQSIGCEVQVHVELESTSDRVRELGQRGFPHGVTVFAECQTAGRGRRENRWCSEPGQDLLLSVLLRPQVKVELWPRLTTLAALALCRTIESCTSLQPAIKWPNDIYIHDRKTAGILAESFTDQLGGFMVLGLGLNVNTLVLPPELQDSATSLRLAHGQTSAVLDRERLAIALLRQLNQLSSSWEHGYPWVVAEVRTRSWLIGKPIRALLEGKEITGMAVDLNGEGHLLMEMDDGRLLALSSAEQVRVR